MNKRDFSKLTPCGGFCDDCGHLTNGDCKGCIATGGTCIHMWQESHGICKVYSCCNEHKVLFCGLCDEFPCDWLETWFDGWNKDGIKNLAKLRAEYLEEDRNE